MMYSKEGSTVKIKPVPPLFITSYDKKFNGKSWETELGLNIYDFDARGYMPDIVRTFQQDPLAEMFYGFSPQSFLNNNPLYFVDPTGMSASPIYDENGNFLATDSEGFKGEILFIEKKVYNILMNDKNNLDSNGKLLHSQAEWTGENLDEVIGTGESNSFTQKEIDMVNNAVSDVVSKTEGIQFKMSDLHNGKTSSYFAIPDVSTSNGIDYIVKSSNDAHPYSFTDPDTPASIGGNTMTYNLTSKLWSGGEFTVNNIQNAAVHEGNGHFVSGITGEGKGHSKAYQMQMNHSSWKGTTTAWKKEIINSLNLINQGKL